MKPKILYTKHIILLALIALTCNSIYCQIGIRLGVGASDIVFAQGGQTPYLGYEINSLTHNFPIHSFQAGVIGQLEISPHLNFSTGILYSQQGLDYSTACLYDDMIFRIYISYIKIPLLVKINTQIKNNRSSGAYLGPYISGTLKASKLTDVQDTRIKENLYNVNEIDLGLMLGYSWDIGRNPGHLFFDFRCSYSLINMMEALEGLSKFSDPEKELARNAGIVFALEYLLQ